NVALLAARDAERVVGHVQREGGARADVGAVTDADGCDERGVRADERARADDGRVLLLAIIVAGDGARADVGARADLGVAKIGQVAGLGARAEARVLDLDEVADLGALAKLRARA